MKLLIGVVSARDWNPFFGTSYVDLVQYISIHGINGESCKLNKMHIMHSSNLCYHRQEILDHAIADNFTHVMFLDDDVTFPNNSVDRLAQHNLPFVGINLRKKSTQVLSTAHDLDGLPLDTSAGKTGLEEVMTTTMALFLSDVEELKKVPKPHFATISNTPATDDVYYHAVLRAAGYQVWIDHDLSRRCGHVGDYTFTFEDGNEFNEFDGRNEIRHREATVGSSSA